MKRKIVVISVVAAMLLSLAGCGDGDSIGVKTVETQAVKSDMYEVKLNYQGVVKAKETKNYSFVSGGKVEKIFVTEGQTVSAGDKLAQLDSVELMSQAAQSANNAAISANNLNKTEATYLTNITNGEINIKTLENGIAAYKKAMTAAKSSVDAVQSNINAYKANVAAAEKGIKDFEKSIPVANQGVEALEKTVKSEETQIEAMKQNMEAYEKKLDSAKQSVELAKTNLERMKSLYEKGAIAKSELENMEVQCADAEASYQQALAQKTSNQASLEQLEAGHQANLANLQGKRNEASSMNTQLEANRANVKSMYAQLDTLNSQKQQAEAQYNSSQSQLYQMENQLKSAKIELQNARNSMSTDVAASEASERISRLAKEQADRAVDNATLTAETDGYVMSINVKEGEMTGAGTPVIIMKSQTKIVSIGVSIDDYSKLDGIEEIRINGRTAGMIDNISQYPDESTRTYTVDISFEDSMLTMGEIVDVELVTSQSMGAFVPIDSVINLDGIDYVYKVNDDETVSRTEVKLGEVKDDTVRVKNLTNERIVVSGIKSLSDNDKIKEVGESDE